LEWDYKIQPVADDVAKVQGDRSMDLRETVAKQKQESCAIAKMTAQCAIYMGALKFFGTP